MLLRAAIICLMINIIRGDEAAEEEKPEPKTQPSFLSPVRPLPCHSVTMIKDVRPTEFLFIAPGSSGDCSFIFEGLEDAQLDIKVRNLKSNLPRGNGDPCEDGQVRLYNYKGSGEVNLAQRLCDNEKEASMLTDSNMAIVASSLIDGSFSVVARSLRQVDFLHGSDVNQFLSPPESTTHNWDTKKTEEDTELDEEIVIDNEPSAFDNSDGSEEPIILVGNMTDTNNTNPENTTKCGYDYYGHYICTNLTMNMNETNTSNQTDYNTWDYNQPNYQAPSGSYNPQPSYTPPYQHNPTYQAPVPTYAAPKPIYSPPTYKPPQYTAPKPSYHAPNSYYDAPTPTYEAPNPYGAPKPTYEAPNPSYGAPEPIYEAPKPTYEAPNPSYGAPKPIYEVPTYEVPKPIYHSPSNYYGHKPSHTGYDYKPVYEKPFRPSQPIPNNYWAGYKTHSHTNSYNRSPVWYQHRNDYGPYPGKPTKHIDLTHDSYPMYPSYYNPGYYGSNNTYTTTPSANTTTEATTTTAKPLTSTQPATKQGSTTMKRPVTTTKSTTKHNQPTTKHQQTTKPHQTTTKQPSTTTKRHEILGIPIPWTANVTITSGDNLNNSIEDDEDKIVTTTPRFTLNKIIKNLPKLFKQQ